MAVRTSFTAGEVLAAADLTDTFGAKIDYALTTNAQAGTGASAYTFVLADASRLTTSSGATAKTFTIPPQASVAWANNSIIRVVNYGAGALTIAGGAGVTVTNTAKTLAQYESAAAIRTGSNAWTLVPFSGGVGNADFSNTATGTYTDGGIDYKYITFTGNGSLVVDKEGFADLLVVAGGGGGAGGSGGYGGSGGGAGGLVLRNILIPQSTYSVVVGGGGGGGSGNGGKGNVSSILTSDKFNGFSTEGGGYGAAQPYGGNGGNGGSGGGNGGLGIVGQGSDGGFWVGGGATGSGSLPTPGPGLTSSITGTAILYSQGGTRKSYPSSGLTNRGYGGDGQYDPSFSGNGASGGSGIVIVRVAV